MRLAVAEASGSGEAVAVAVPPAVAVAAGGGVVLSPFPPPQAAASTPNRARKTAKITGFGIVPPMMGRAPNCVKRLSGADHRQSEANLRPWGLIRTKELHCRKITEVLRRLNP